MVTMPTFRSTKAQLEEEIDKVSKEIEEAKQHLQDLRKKRGSLTKQIKYLR